MWRKKYLQEKSQKIQKENRELKKPWSGQSLATLKQSAQDRRSQQIEFDNEQQEKENPQNSEPLMATLLEKLSSPGVPAKSQKLIDEQQFLENTFGPDLVPRRD